MRELDRQATEPSKAPLSRPAPPGGRDPVGGGPPNLQSIGVVGRGRVGTALARALREAGFTVRGPLGRQETTRAGLTANAESAGGRSVNGAAPLDAVLLCVPDAEIAGAARAVSGAAPLVGHTSGATPLSVLASAGCPGPGLFGLHPLQTFAGREDRDRLAGAGCAIAGSSPRATRAARELAERLGLVPFEIADEHRPAYHAAASIASNFLVTLQDAAETIARGAGMEPVDARRALLPLVRTTVENWAELGPELALSGPVARGDEDTVALQHAAVERDAPGLLPLFEALVERTRHLALRAAGRTPVPARGGSGGGS